MIRTRGEIITHIRKVEIKFHVVDDSFPIQQSGILGVEFLLCADDVPIADSDTSQTHHINLVNKDEDNTNVESLVASIFQLNSPNDNNYSCNMCFNLPPTNFPDFDGTGVTNNTRYGSQADPERTQGQEVNFAHDTLQVSGGDKLQDLVALGPLDETLIRSIFINTPSYVTTTRDKISMRKDNLVHFTSVDGTFLPETSRDLLNQSKFSVREIINNAEEPGTAIASRWNDHFVFHLIIKRTSDDRINPKDIENTVLSLRNLLVHLQVKTVSIPQRKNNGLSNAEWSHFFQHLYPSISFNLFNKRFTLMSNTSSWIDVVNVSTVSKWHVKCHLTVDLQVGVTVKVESRVLSIVKILTKDTTL
ncbi:Protein of unknown function [Cotesia congregata]|uniref:Uncharacterized protein n=1 Tax=Cotesia congregata TaxID=51543 RepID=A0A8J2HI54_COTCN|nr:Protein of unknown function [Cotesia congregata]